MSTTKVFTNATGAPVADNTNIMTAGPRGPALLQDIWLIEKLAQFDREVIPVRGMQAKGWGVGFSQGTKMFVNLPSEADRENVIAYLNTLQK